MTVVSSDKRIPQVSTRFELKENQLKKRIAYLLNDTVLAVTPEAPSLRPVRKQWFQSVWIDLRHLPIRHGATVTMRSKRPRMSILAHSLGGFDGNNIPTASAVLFRFDVSLWSSITTGVAECFSPKMLA
jgi:hypothetical protein